MERVATIANKQLGLEARVFAYRGAYVLSIVQTWIGPDAILSMDNFETLESAIAQAKLSIN